MSILPRSAIAIIATTTVFLSISMNTGCTKQKNADAKTPSPVVIPPVPPTYPHAASDDTAEIKGQPGQLQSVDVLSGDPLNKSLFTDFDGKRLFFCCPVSKSNFEQNRQHYIDAIKKKGIVLAEATKTNNLEDLIQGIAGAPQSVDIISGKPINPYVYTDLEDGSRIYHCCTIERDTFQLHKDAYLAAIRKRGIILSPRPPSDE